MTIGAAPGEPRQIDAGAAADFEHRVGPRSRRSRRAAADGGAFRNGTDRDRRRTRASRRDACVISRSWMCRSQYARTSSIVATRRTILSRRLLRWPPHDPRPRPRSTARTFDVLVVGGGIYGLTIAYDAAQRGLSVALIERDDFGSGTSFNHLRTIHGGLRYLQTLDIRARARIDARAARRSRASRRTPSGRCRSSLPLYRSLTPGQDGDARRLPARSRSSRRSQPRRAGALTAAGRPRRVAQPTRSSAFPACGARA